MLKLPAILLGAALLQIGAASAQTTSCAELVKSVVSKHLDQPKTSMSSKLSELGADDLAIVELVMAFEEKLGIEIPDEDGETVFSKEKLSEIAKYLAKKTKKCS